MEQIQCPEVEYLNTVYHLDSNDEANFIPSCKQRRLSEIHIQELPLVECYLEDNNNVRLVAEPEHVQNAPEVLRRKVPTQKAKALETYHLSPDPTKTICGTFHQNSDGHGMSSYRGTQCTAMALCAILTAQSLPVRTWSSRNMDAVLISGHGLHAQLVTSLHQKSSHPRIAIHELKHGDSHWYVLPAPCRNVDWTKDNPRRLCYSVHKSGEYFGFVSPKYSGPGDVSMEAALTRILDNDYKDVLITVGDQTGAIIKDEHGKLRYFDSHSNNKIGRTYQDGTSVLLTFETPRDFVRHMRRRKSDPRDRFEMFGLSVKCQRSVAVVRPTRRVLPTQEQ